MKNILTLLLLSILALHSQGQDFSFQTSSTGPQKDKLTERSAGIKAIGSINNEAYYLFQPYTAIYSGATIGGKMNYYLAKYNADLQLQQKVTVNLNYKGQEMSFEGVQILQDKLMLFTSFQNRDQKKHYLFAQSINLSTLEGENDMKLIAELDYSGIGKYNNTSVSYEVSQDESKIMFFYTILNKKGEPLKFEVQVFDNQMEKLWHNNVFPKFDEGVFSFKQFRVDNNGDVYLLGIHYSDKKNYYESADFKGKGFFSADTYFTDVPNFTYQLYRFSDKGQKEESENIGLEYKFIRSLNFHAENGVVKMYGTYSAPQTISAKGIFSYTYNISNRKISGLSTQEFSQELMEQGFSERELKRFKRSIDNKGEWDPFDYKIGDIKTMSTGEKYFTAEQFILGTKVQRAGNTVTYSTIYLYNDIYVVRLDQKNQISRIDKVSKRQYALNTPRYNSFMDFEVKGNIYTIYNTIINKDSMFKNVELGETYISKVSGAGVSTKTYQTPESFKVPLIMPVTQVELDSPNLIYGLMSPNYKYYLFEKISINE